GCTPTTLGTSTRNLARRMDAGGQQFETEFRPAFYIDKVEIDVPLSYDLNWVNLVMNTPYWRASQLGTGGTISNIIPDASSGSVRTYYNPNNGSWKVFNITTVNNYGGAFNVNVTPTCAT